MDMEIDARRVLVRLERRGARLGSTHSRLFRARPPAAMSIGSRAARPARSLLECGYPVSDAASLNSGEPDALNFLSAFHGSRTREP